MLGFGTLNATISGGLILLCTLAFEPRHHECLEREMWFSHHTNVFAWSASRILNQNVLGAVPGDCMLHVPWSTVLLDFCSTHLSLLGREIKNTKLTIHNCENIRIKRGRDDVVLFRIFKHIYQCIVQSRKRSS